MPLETEKTELQKLYDFMSEADRSNYATWVRWQDETDPRKKQALLELAEHKDAIAQKAIAAYKEAVARKTIATYNEAKKKAGF